MPQLRLKATGALEEIPESALQQALATGLYEPPGLDVAIPIVRDAGAGRISYLPGPLAAQEHAARPATEAEIRAAERTTRLEREHGGAGGALATGVESALDTASFGAFGAVTDTIWGDDYTEDRRERRAANPEAGVVGTIGGAVLPAVLSGGTGAVGALARATPAGMASRLGANIARGGGVAQQATGFAVEGALYGAGHVLSESILHDKELSAEAFLAGAGTGALWGGAAGGGMSLLSSGARAGRKAVEKATAGRAELARLQGEAKSAAKEAERAARLADRLKLENARAANRAGLEGLKQQGRADLVAARGEAQAQVAGIRGEAQIGVAEKRTAAELAKAEAQAITARARAAEASEALAVEQAKFERAKLVMDGRIELADTYTAGWRRAAGSREAVAASKLDAAEIGADAKMRTGFADALVKSGREDAGYLVEELIPAKLRTPQAAEAAKGELLNHTARVADATDDLVRQADELMAMNPALEPEIRAVRDRAAAAAPAARSWSDKQAGSRAFQEEHLDELRDAGFSVPSQPVRGLPAAQSADEAAPRVFAERDTAWAEQAMNVAKTPGESRAMATYTGADYGLVNRYLRGATQHFGEPLDETTELIMTFADPKTGLMRNAKLGEVVQDLDSLMAKSAIPEDVVLYRGVSARDKFDPRKTFKAGEAFTDTGYQSTSLSREKAVGHGGRTGTLLEIEAPAGTRGAYQQLGEEAEIVLQRGMTYRVLSVADEGEGQVVRMRIDDAVEAAPTTPVAPTAPAAPDVPNDFAEGFETLRGAEQAQYDLAQAIRPYLDDVTGMSLDDALKGMDDAVTKQDEIVSDAMVRQAEASSSIDDTLRSLDEEAIEGALGPPPGAQPSTGAPPARGRGRGAAGEGLAIVDLLADVGGLPSANDIPVVGPLLSVYLKYRAVAGALGKLGIRVGGPVANIARTGAAVQDRASQAVGLLVKGAEKGTAVAARGAAPLTATLSKPLWDPIEEEAPARPKTPATPSKKAKDPQKLFEKRQEEILRAMDDPEGTKRQIAESVPAPPALANAIAEAMMRRLDWLSGVMPQDPRAPALKPTSYTYPIADLQRFADAVRASGDPLSVLDDLAFGPVTPVAAEALRVVYPRLYQQVQDELIEQVANSSKPIPYQRKNNLALVFDVPLDGTMTPEYRAARQQEYAMAAENAQPPASGPQLKLSQQEELGPMRRAMR